MSTTIVILVVLYFVYTQYRNQALADEFYMQEDLIDCVQTIGSHACVAECESGTSAWGYMNKLAAEGQCQNSINNVVRQFDL